MKCPFLEEVRVSYCKAYPIKKLIPCGGSKTVSLCMSDEHHTCSEFRAVAGARGEQPREVSEMTAERENLQTIKETMKERPGKERLCIWAKLGVVSYRLCTLNYQCDKCQFAQSLMDANGRYAEAPEMFNVIERLRSLPAGERKCRYMLMGEVSYKLCPNSYQCGTCEYDQMMHDSVYGHPKVLARMAKTRRVMVKDFLLMSHIYFDRKHTWLRKVSADTVRVGLDDFAQRLLGKIEGIDFSSTDEVRRGEIAWGVRSRMGNARLVSPVDGSITRINEHLSKDSSLLNTDPYDKGWVLELRPFNLEESLKELMKGDTAKDWLAEEIDRLSHRIESDIGVTVADGGTLIQTVERLDKREWENLVKDFLFG